MGKGYALTLILIFFNLLCTIPMVFNLEQAFGAELIFFALIFIGALTALYGLFEGKEWAFPFSTLLFAIIVINMLYLLFNQSQPVLFITALLTGLIGLFYSVLNINSVQYPDVVIENYDEPLNLELDKEQESVIKPKSII